MECRVHDLVVPARLLPFVEELEGDDQKEA